ncbi:uncharacterized protein [Macrobrachium rosenbergii]|uniref:uncharacterized protein n=1 Tax=Macrobrachium rosenbergii TaxID=79674 RepID=UPI0034D608C1
MRSIQSNGLKQRYETDADFALSLKMLSALAFVPVHAVIGAFEELCDSDAIPLEAQPVVDYMEDTWIGRPDRRLVRRPPQFPHKMWNVYQAVLEDLPKTNNSVEGWHRGFEAQLASYHPNIWKFVECIKREQTLSNAKIEQYLAGKEPPLKKRKYRDSAKRIKRIVLNYDASEPVIDYLRGLAHNISF